MADQVAALFGLSPAFLLVTAVVGFFGFVVSATFGIGGVVLLIPVLSMALPPVQAVAVAAPVMLVNNLGKSWVFRSAVDVKATALLSGLALPAAYLSARVANTVDDRLLLVAVALLILVSVAVDRLRTPATAPMGGLALFLWGGLTGAISGICGAAGPPTAIGLRRYGLSKNEFVGTVAVFSVCLQLAKIPAYVDTGALPPGLLPLAALLAALSLVAVAVGPRLLRQVSEDKFRIVVDGLFVVSAVWLLAEAMLMR